MSKPAEEEEKRNLLRELIKKRDVKFLAQYYFEFNLSKGQQDLVRKIAFRECRRLSISAMTRYGKTQCVALGIALLLLMDIPLKIAFIGPKQEQAAILRQYMAELIYKCPDLLKRAQISVIGEGKITKEASRKRMTFSSGAEYRVFSAEGEADRLMGFGADIVIKDEACLINRKANTKIMRMLGDNPEESILIELYNPWERDNNAFDNTLKEEFEVIQIGWEQAVEEGRTTKEFVDEQRTNMLPIEFTVLYESLFPDESEDSIFTFKMIKEAIDKVFSWPDPVDYINIISCDVADLGRDKTVVKKGKEYNNGCYEVNEIYFEPKSEPMQLSDTLVGMVEKTRAKKLKIDTIGIGRGVVSRCQQLIAKKGLDCRVIACHYGESPSTGIGKASTVQDRRPDSDKKRFKNKKAQQFFRLRDIMAAGKLSMPKHNDLTSELLKMRFEIITGTEQIKIIDPEEKSPDFADALVYFTWKEANEMVVMF